MCKVQGEYGETKAGLRASLPERTLGKNYCFPSLDGGGGKGRGRGGEGLGSASHLPQPAPELVAGGCRPWDAEQNHQKGPLWTQPSYPTACTVSEMQNSPEVD